MYRLKMFNVFSHNFENAVPLITLAGPITDYFLFRKAGETRRNGTKTGWGSKWDNNNQRLAPAIFEQLSDFPITHHASRINHVHQCAPMLAKTRFKNIFEPLLSFWQSAAHSFDYQRI